MRTLLSLSLLFLVPARQDNPAPADPLSALQRFELSVLHWEGSFGTYLSPRPGQSIQLDLARIGTRELLGISRGEQGQASCFDVPHLALRSDRVEGDARSGWTRRVVLSARRTAETPERTVLELVVQHEAQPDEPVDPRRGRRSNLTHVNLRVHTLRDDDTVREYGRARITIDRDTGARFPAGR